MRAHWRRGVITLIMGTALVSSAPLYSAISSALHVTPTASIGVADQMCPAGLNWDNLLQACN